MTSDPQSGLFCVSTALKAMKCACCRMLTLHTTFDCKPAPLKRCRDVDMFCKFQLVLVRKNSFQEHVCGSCYVQRWLRYPPPPTPPPCWCLPWLWRPELQIMTQSCLVSLSHRWKQWQKENTRYKRLCGPCCWRCCPPPPSPSSAQEGGEGKGDPRFFFWDICTEGADW